jgi:hypothetical protein
MIIDIILGLFTTVIQAFMDTLPEWSLTLPPMLHDVIAGALAYDDLFPISEGLITLSAQATLVGGMTVIRWGKQAIDWIADVIP